MDGHVNARVWGNQVEVDAIWTAFYIEMQVGQLSDRSRKPSIELGHAHVCNIVDGSDGTCPVAAV
jgi:hypothetical protein